MVYLGELNHYQVGQIALNNSYGTLEIQGSVISPNNGQKLYLAVVLGHTKYELYSATQSMNRTWQLTWQSLLEVSSIGGTEVWPPPVLTLLIFLKQNHTFHLPLPSTLIYSKLKKFGT